MKAAVFESFGEPSQVLNVRDVPDPKPGPGQVRVRMILSPINPSDLLVVQGLYGVLPKLPSTPGFEGVGIVDEVGPGVLARMLKLKGKRVVAINSAGGNWAETAIIPARQARPIPDDIPDEQAACFFVNPATVLAMARHVLAVPKGEWLLQSAAGSTLGRMLINLGRHDGFKTLNVVRRREAIDELKKLGGDAVISSSDGPIDEQVRRITGGDRGAVRRRPGGRRDRHGRLPFAGPGRPAHALRHLVGRADHRRPPAGDLGPSIRRGVLARPLDAPAFDPVGVALVPGDRLAHSPGRPPFRDRSTSIRWPRSRKRPARPRIVGRQGKVLRPPWARALIVHPYCREERLRRVDRPDLNRRPLAIDSTRIL